MRSVTFRKVSCCDSNPAAYELTERMLSRRPVQVDRKRAYHEAELLQDHSVESLSGGDCVSAEGAELAGSRCAGP